MILMTPAHIAEKPKTGAIWLIPFFLLVRQGCVASSATFFFRIEPARNMWTRISSFIQVCREEIANSKCLHTRGEARG